MGILKWLAGICALIIFFYGIGISINQIFLDREKEEKIFHANIYKACVLLRLLKKTAREVYQKPIVKENLIVRNNMHGINSTQTSISSSRSFRSY